MNINNLTYNEWHQFMLKYMVFKKEYCELSEKYKSLEKECSELRKKHSDVGEYDEELMRYGKPKTFGQGNA